MNKRITALLLSAAAVLSMAFTPAAVMADASKATDASAASSEASETSSSATAPFISLGADLSDAQKATVLELLGLTKTDLDKDTVVTVTNEEEHKYLDSYLSSDVIGTKALSSCKVVSEKSGHGITVETHNISYVTAGMYENALATAGMKDASVTVAAPTNISGTAALVGAMEAYSKMNGDVIQPQLMDGATDELVTTSQVAEDTGDSDKTEQLIAAVKQVVAEKGYTSDSDIDSTINDVAGQLNISLSDEDRQLIRELMQKLSSLDLNATTLTEQAQNIYNEIKNGNIDLSKYGISSSEANSFLTQFQSLFDSIIAWFQKNFGG